MNDKKEKIVNPRLPGIVYFIVTAFGVGAQLIRSSIIMPNGINATVNNITSNAMLFKIGFLSDLIMMTAFLFLPLVLYRLLKDTDKTLATLMVIFVIVSVPMNMLNMLNYYAGFQLLTNAGYMSVMGSEQINAQAMFYFGLYEYGYRITQIFFGLWLLPLGLLVIKSGYYPKVLGILLVAACFGHLIELVITLILPSMIALTYPGLAIAAAGEIGFCLWALIVGAKMPKTA